MNQNIVLEMRAVSKIYSGRAVLDRLTLEIPAGSVVGLLGKNGAGKTTLLRCALGLARPQHGTVTLLDEPAWNLSSSAKQHIGYVAQNPQLYPWMQVRHIIALHGLVLCALESAARGSAGAGMGDSAQPPGRHVVGRRAAKTGHRAGAGA